MNPKLKIFFVTFIILLFFSSAGPLTSADVMEDIGLKNSVVKIFVYSNPPDFFKPWQTKGSGHSTGSGCIISGNRVLTSAHVVSNHTFIQLKKSTDSKKYTARVESIGNDCDLAVLSVDDPEFFEGTKPISFGDLPMLKDTVTAIGYPVGGDQLSVTEGVVSRIDVTPYSHGSRQLIAVQIDAAINPGNSGGPVIQDGKLIGIAFQGLKKGENIGYIIPTPIIRHFFEDLKDGHYDGFRTLGIITNKTENPDMQRFYKLKNGVGGVLVTGIIPDSPAAGRLKEGDIITELDEVAIARDGTIEFRDSERIAFTYLISRKQVGDMIPLKFIRDGEEINLSLELQHFVELVPKPFYYESPTYYIHGGLVFTVLSNDLLRNWKLDFGVAALLNASYYAFGPGRMRPKGRKEICVLLNVLPDNANAGYHDIKFQIVDKINGRNIKLFKDLVMTLHEGKDKYTVIDTEERNQILLDNTNIAEVNSRVFKKYHIPSQYSKDVGRWLKREA